MRATLNIFAVLTTLVGSRTLVSPQPVLADPGQSCCKVGNAECCGDKCESHRQRLYRMQRGGLPHQGRRLRGPAPSIAVRLPTGGLLLAGMMTARPTMDGRRSHFNTRR